MRIFHGLEKTHLSVTALKILVFLVAVAGASAAGSGILFRSDPLIINAATFDLLVSVPAIYWFFIRKTSIPSITILPVFLVSAACAYFILPLDKRALFEAAVFYAFPAVELGALVYVALKAVAIRRRYKRLHVSGMDAFERLRHAISENIYPPSLARALAFELGAAGIVFLKWRRESHFEAFSYHKRNGAVVILSVLVFLLGAETTVLHFLLSAWSLKAAWVVTALSIYFTIQIVAHLKAVVLRPIAVTEDKILFRCGLLADLAIELSVINSVRLADGRSEELTQISPLGKLSAPNVSIFLKQPMDLFGPYGIRKKVSGLTFHVDDPEVFIRTVNTRVSNL